jgi:hypothetical protein
MLLHSCDLCAQSIGWLLIRVVDLHCFNADLDTDPAFFLIANPDPDPNAYPDPIQIQGFDDQKLGKIYS